MLRKYPEYFQFDFQSKMPDIYRLAGAAGNMIIAAPDPVMVPALRLTPSTIAQPALVSAPAYCAGQAFAHPPAVVKTVQVHWLSPAPIKPAL